MKRAAIALSLGAGLSFLLVVGCSHAKPSPTAPTPSPGAVAAGSNSEALASVPDAYRSLYNQVEQIIHDADAAISAKWDGTKYPVIYSSWLLSANSNAAISIMNSGFSLAGAQTEIDNLRALGVQAATVEIGYPVLDRDFYTALGKDPNLAGRFLDYYLGLASYVRQSGMKLIVETNPLLTVSIANGGGALDPTLFYKSLSLEQYQAGRSAHNVIVARTIKPDYMSIQTEPDTEARDVQNAAIAVAVSNPASDTAMVGRFVTDLDAAAIPGLHSTTKVGAGVGPWLPNWRQYVDGLVTITGLDLIETHIYNLQPSLDETNRVMQMADMAHAANKAVGMAEFWPNKSLDTSDSIFDIRVRDDFSFWSPLDQQFLTLMAKLANYKRFEYISPTGWVNFFSYLDYRALPCTPVFPASVPTPNRACDDQLRTQQIRQASQALNTHQATDTGRAYTDVIARFSK